MSNAVYDFCLISGGGDLPSEILKSHMNGKVFVIILEESGYDPSFFKNLGIESEVISMVKVGKIIKAIRQRGICNICFVGKIKKPSFSSLRPDFTGLFLLFKLLRLKLKGDNSIFTVIINFLEDRGFMIKSASEISPELVMKKGLLTKKSPSVGEMKDISFGFHVIDGISKFDIGQAVVVQESTVIAVEGIEGTDNLIIRCANLKYKSKNLPILIKGPKCAQTLKIDMPVIGPQTIKNAIDAGFAGVAIKAESCLILQKEVCIEMANRHNIFLLGL